MTHSHTHGPWDYDDDGCGFIRKNGKTIADPHCELALDLEEREANARLIAAAPDMLEALESALDVIEYEDQPGLYKKIENALNKAKGL